MTELESRLKSVEGTVDEIHVIAINEVNSKFNNHCIELCELQLNGYDMFSTNLSTSDGRGIIVYAKHELEATPVIFKSQFQESVWISLSVNRNSTAQSSCRMHISQSK